MPATILLIEDDADIRETLRALFENEGAYSVIDTGDTVRGLELLRTSPEALIVLFDYRMPRVDGAGLLALAEQEGWLTQRHAFVCMSGADRAHIPPVVQELLARYQVPLVAKPFDVDEMMAIIRTAEQRLRHV